ncbi:bifunctional 3'-5' exonuclease/DNA polymerase [Kibdelosporangium philippinense]|uniref:DNA-directed DNA polymerase n=1 Tax=Kibdelosporangium philippinense TaxID=211113 RepID=A0ABS8ZH77_9PSEU|nr:bifunctional 3'-5' exonuclease/DNA polymerase [Kibdelosporangium philippinense]MCE7007154.1 bifunctional 3'-5' exonuclease/DNA polymerase [Kibdelosporangium philippinense]
MLVFVSPGRAGAGSARVVDATTAEVVADHRPSDLAAWMANFEVSEHPRWILPAVDELYPQLLQKDIRLSRCYDLTLSEGLLLNHEGRRGSHRNPGAAWARLHGRVEPEDKPPPAKDAQPALFELDERFYSLDQLAEVYTDQQRRILASAHPDRLRLLVTSESAGALAAAEMSHCGLPWSEKVHLELLESMLGPRPLPGARPAKLADLAEKIIAAFGGRSLNPDSPPSVVKAFAREGIDIPNTRAWVLKEVDHPAVEPLLEYKELARMWTAHGWSWIESWVHDGRFRPEYVVGGVVSGRWATRGGAALQLPKALRKAVRALPGWSLVVADAAQLEPRVLAALSEDQKLAEFSRDVDLYAGLAADSFEGDRGKAKIAMLSAMYGGTSGGAGPLLAVLRKRFPQAVGHVEQAAQAGEQGRMVRSQLGRTSPYPSESWRALMERSEGTEDEMRKSRQASRDWGRFTRNFVVQASAADWALVLLVVLRRRLTALAPAAEIVFYQHDEFMVHCPASAAELVRTEVLASAKEASKLVFGDTPVQFPLEIATVDSYADAK